MLDAKIAATSKAFVSVQAQLAELVAEVPADDRAEVAGRAAAVIAEMDDFIAKAWYYAQPKPFDPSVCIEEMDDTADLGPERT